jgi:hypothetical protein
MHLTRQDFSHVGYNLIRSRQSIRAYRPALNRYRERCRRNAALSNNAKTIADVASARLRARCRRLRRHAMCPAPRRTEPRLAARGTSASYPKAGVGEGQRSRDDVSCQEWTIYATRALGAANQLTLRRLPRLFRFQGGDHGRTRREGPTPAEVHPTVRMWNASVCSHSAPRTPPQRDASMNK